MRRIQGLGHIGTVVADAIDRVHPGFYRAARDAGSESHRRLAHVAREAWDFRDSVVSTPPRRALALVRTPPGAPPAPEAVRDETVLTAWLREVETYLEADAELADRSARTAHLALHDELPAILSEYARATRVQQDAVRQAFSRFYMVRHHLGGFAALQLAAVKGDHGTTALRTALLAEALLDRGLDWRDEMMLLRDLKRAAESAGLPFTDLVEEAAACSSPEGAEFLLGVARE